MAKPRMDLTAFVGKLLEAQDGENSGVRPTKVHHLTGHYPSRRRQSHKSPGLHPSLFATGAG